MTESTSVATMRRIVAADLAKRGGPTMLVRLFTPEKHGGCVEFTVRGKPSHHSPCLNLRDMKRAWFDQAQRLGIRNSVYQEQP